MSRPASPWAAGLAAATTLCLLTARVAAEPVTPANRPAEAKRAEAEARYDRGIFLLEKRDEARALAEFNHAYQLVPERQTLLMIGVLHASMKRPVDAVRTLDRVLRDPGTLTPEQLAVARQKRAEQAGRVGYLRITTSVPATIQVDGIDVSRTPLSEPLPVTSGTRIITALSAGHLPARKEVTIAGSVTAEVGIDLSPSEQRLAHLYVRTELPDADVVIDGERVARTPLSQSITITPGRHVVEVRRSGYQSASQEITLGDGATGELDFAPTESMAGGVPQGKLVLQASETEAELVVDGTRRGVYRGPLTLLAGRHQLRVLRAGFETADRLVEIPAGGEGHLPVTLYPTPETRAAYVARARSMGRWGWISAVGGGTVAIAATALVATNAGPLGDARDGRSRVLATYEAGQPCHRQGGGDHFQCDADLAAANDDVGRHQLKRNLGLAALGVGLAGAAVGAYLLLGAEDPTRYNRLFANVGAPGVELGAQLDPGTAAGGLTLRGHF